MSINSQGDFSSLDPNAVPVGGPSLTPQTQEAAPSQSPYESTIQASDLEVLALFYASSIPMLSPPNNQVSNTGDLSIGAAGIAALQIEEETHNIISNMWDNYIADLRELAERDREEDLRRETVDADKAGPQSAVQYFAYLMAITPTERADETGQGDTTLSIQFSDAVNQWQLVNSTGAGGASADNNSVGAVSGTATTDALMLAMMLNFPSSQEVTTNPVFDALSAVGPSTGLPADYQTAAALVAALLYNGAASRAMTGNVDPTASSGPFHDLNFAKDFAQNVINTIVTHNLEQTDPSTPEGGRNNMVKLMLAAIALNMLFRAGYGGMEGGDLEAILAGNTADIPDEIRGLIEQLASYINSYLPTDQASRQEWINRLTSYVNNKESVDSMVETGDLLSESLDTGSIDTNRLSADPR
jgi:hypothetical protein